MGSAALIPVEKYLHTTYRPDRDYVDGEVEERNLGEQWHGLVQGMIASIFRSRRHDWRLRSIPEQRVQISATRYRVPDICVVESSDPIEGILRKPPVLCVEVLSPEDRFSRIVDRVREYSAMGVPHAWIIDPISRAVWTVAGTAAPVAFLGDELTLPGTPVRIPIADIFAEIDEAPPA